jgi:hypothetical protein
VVLASKASDTVFLEPSTFEANIATELLDEWTTKRLPAEEWGRVIFNGKCHSAP